MCNYTRATHRLLQDCAHFVYRFAFASLLCSPLRAADAQQAVEDIRGDLLRWVQTTATFMGNEQDLGMFLTATQLPYVGRVLISADSSKWSCSGVLISSRHVLTAAHCLCGTKEESRYAPSAEKCAPTLDALSVKVLFPTAGIFAAKKPYAIHPEYSSPGEPIEAGKTKIADLAVLTLETDVPLAVAIPTIARGHEGERYMLAGYGWFSFSVSTHDESWESGIPYQDGVKQVSRQTPARYSLKQCGTIPAIDTFCTKFTALGIPEGPDQSSGACGGDSGSPLIGIRGGEANIVGLLSYFSPPGQPCDGTGNRFNHFVDVWRYSDWIAGQVRHESKTAAMGATCIEGILKGPRTFRLEVDSGVLSITGFNARGNERPFITVRDASSGSLDCSNDEQLGISVCRVPKRLQLEIQMPEGLCQLSMCETSH